MLLDENLPVELRGHLLQHDVRTAGKAGLLQFKNGALLPILEESYDVLLTMDKGILFQHDHRGKSLRIGVIQAINSRFETIKPLIPHIDRFVAGLLTGKLAFIRADGIHESEPDA